MPRPPHARLRRSGAYSNQSKSAGTVDALAVAGRVEPDHDAREVVLRRAADLLGGQRAGRQRAQLLGGRVARRDGERVRRLVGGISSVTAPSGSGARPTTVDAPAMRLVSTASRPVAAAPHGQVVVEAFAGAHGEARLLVRPREARTRAPRGSASRKCCCRRTTAAGDATSSSVTAEPVTRRKPGRAASETSPAFGLRTKFQASASAGRSKSSRTARAGGACGGSARRGHAQLDVAAVADRRPAVGREAHRRQERLAAEVVEAPLLRSHAQEHRPGRAVVELDEIGVAGRLDRVLAPIAVGQDRVARRTVRTVRTATRRARRPPRARTPCRPRRRTGSSAPSSCRRARPRARCRPSPPRSPASARAARPSPDRCAPGRRAGDPCVAPLPSRR